MTKKVGASADTLRTFESPANDMAQASGGNSVISGTSKTEGVNRKALDKVNFQKNFPMHMNKSVAFMTSKLCRGGKIGGLGGRVTVETSLGLRVLKQVAF